MKIKWQMLVYFWFSLLLPVPLLMQFLNFRISYQSITLEWEQIMSYELTFEARKHYLYCFVTGTESYETSLEYWREIAEKCDELGFDKALVEEELEGQLSDTEMFKVCSEFPKLGLLGKKIAFIDRHADHDSGNQFGETVAFNRGINAYIFENVEDRFYFQNKLIFLGVVDVFDIVDRSDQKEGIIS